MRKLRGIFVLVAISLFVFLDTASAGQFGAPEPVETSNYISVGAGYFYNSDKLELSSNSQDYKFNQNQAYLQLGVAYKSIEFYIRGGAADFKFENAFPSGDFNDDFRAFGTMGVKGFLEFNKYIGVGLFGQGSYFQTYKSQSTGLVGGVSATQEMEIKHLYEIDLGLMLQGKISKICIYGGPFVYWTHADLETTMTRAGVKTSSSNHLNQSNNLGGVGGVAGIRIPIYGGISIEVEGQYRLEFSGGAAIMYSF